MPKAKSTYPADNDVASEAPLQLDPIIEGLLERLPPEGDPWPRAKREAWLSILRQVFDLIYVEPEENSDKQP
jgi:hypothetical protein